jgi:alpha-tubulin suppressor-like RCC1 family protein
MSCGNNAYGQLGLGDRTERLKFTELKDMPSDVISITCGACHTIVQRADGSLMGCGYNYYGQLGLGDGTPRTKLTELKDIPLDVISVTCGAYHTIIQRADGSLMSCGYNAFGQLGLGDSTNRSKLTELKDMPSDVISVTCGAFHTIVQRADGSLMGCGRNDYGQLGDRTYITKLTELKDIPSNIISVTCGAYHTIIQRADGSLMGCGYDGFGQLGLGDSTPRTKLTELKDIPSDIISVSCGADHTIIQRANGSLMGCGDNNQGQLGLGDRTDRTKFTQLKDKISA